MKVRNIHIEPKFVTAMLFVLLASTQTAFGQTTETATRKILIKDKAQITINDANARTGKSGVISDAGVVDYGYLIDNDKTTYWSSSDNITDTITITVRLEDNFSLKRKDTDGNDVYDDLIIYTRRHNLYAKCYEGSIQKNVTLKRAPTVFHLDVSNDGVNWEPFNETYTHTHVNFVMRGYETEEFSRRITTTKTFKYIRFKLRANNSRTMVTGDDDKKLRLLTMSEFNIIRLSKEDNYTDKQIDRFRLVTDYVKKYEEYTFENSQSILDPNNRKKTKYVYQIDSIPDDYCDWTKWVDGKWIGNTDILSQHNIELPNYSYITQDNDPNKLVEHGKRQPTHVIEHELYAIPGDVIALYPYYNLQNIPNYQENFIHWYDYKGGGYLKNDEGYPLLDFLINPAVVGRTKDAGFVNGVWLNEPYSLGDYRQYGTIATFFYPRATYTQEDKLESFDGEYVVAADFSMRFNDSCHVDSEKQTIKEPLLLYRHLFRIKDGKKQADEMTSTKQANETYVKQHFRTVMARAGKYFQVRLDSPIPKYNPSGAGSDVIRSKYYYKISDDDYRRICSCDIVVLDKNGNEIEDHGFKLAEEFNGYGSRKIDEVNYYMCGGGGSYFRMLACDSNNAKSGTYTVRLIGKDYNNKRITTPDGSGHEVIVQEYHITFVNEWAAFVGDEEVLDKDYPTLRAEHFESFAGKPRCKVDFDEYSYLIDLPESERNSYLRADNKNKGKWIYKWPVTWNNSQYGFNYPRGGDFSMYQIVSNSQFTGYVNAFKPNGKPTDYLYDRRYFDTQGSQVGFYYFVNAAADPGVMARMSIDDLCKGSNLYVTAWFAELSNDWEVANLAFNFVVIKKDGSRQLLHTFTTGYIEKNGEWQNVAYSFVPDFAAVGLKEEDIDHYELELDNNVKGSNGADYAVDDIRVYVVRPQVTARQTKPLCNSEDESPIKLSSPYQMILQSVGDVIPTDHDMGEDVDVYYTFLEKEKFYSVYDSISTLEEYTAEQAYTAAFDSAVVRYNYGGGEDITSYGKISFHTFDVRNIPYDETELNKVMFDTANGVEYLSFIVSLTQGDKLLPEKEYLQALFSSKKVSGEITEEKHAWEAFDILDACSPVSAFSIKHYGQIRIDGVPVSSVDEFFVCENQMPVIQLDVMGKDKDNASDTSVVVERNAYLDWYSGSIGEFNAEQSDTYKIIVDGNEKPLDLRTALLQFRLNYPNAPLINEDNIVPTGDFTQDMKDYIIEMINPKEVDGEQLAPKLLLYQSSYVFPPVKFDENEYGESVSRVVAVPTYFETDEYIVCGEPTEVAIPVRRKAPLLQHGIGQIKYPSYLDDVPMRVGLTQLKDVSTGKSNFDTHDKMLNVSIRTVCTAAENSTKLVKDNSDPMIYLVETNDPQYKDLHGQEEDTEGLFAVGMLREMVADKNKDNNIIRMVFDSAFKFKEGYYYRMAVAYNEWLQGTVDDDVPCEGRRVFTIKVVPEYVMWTGATGIPNWNNDHNWRRMTSAELYVAVDDKPDYTTDGVNKGIFAYAPLDFTKVVLPSTEPMGGYPYLYAPKGDATSINIEDSYAGNSVNRTFEWYSDPDDPDINSPVASSSENVLDLENGTVTYDIQYDMTLFDNGLYGYNCRPWYMHTCNEIDFMPAARIYNQQYLDYDKAWVEVELAPSRWYALSSPLKNVVAGDMYMPTSNARQETELFQPIIFSTDKNDRFAPAVYQRSWNKAVANVVKLDHTTNNVAVVTTWSNVFNDVNEQYGAGQGFSIKADVSGVTGFDENGGVLMRLPKADEKYLYYTQDGNTQGDETTINRSKSHKLVFDKENAGGFTTFVDGNSETPRQYFMVGNPFMTDLDLKKFLQKNNDILNQNCWIIGANGSAKEALLVTGNDVISTMSEPYIVAPMQGFFVEAKNTAAKLEGIKFDTSMMVNIYKDENVQRPILKSKSRSSYQSGFDLDGMRITALSNGEVVSTTLIRLSQDASREYLDGEDVMLLRDDEMENNIPVVYSVAGANAVIINSTSSVEGVEIGLTGMADSKDNDEIVLSFDNVNLYDSYLLLDKVTGEKRPIEQGMIVKVSGNVSGRFYIVSANTRGEDITAAEQDRSSISIVVIGKNLTVTTTRDFLDVKVFDMLGHCVKSVSQHAQIINTTLPQGVYVVVANDETEEKSMKVIVRNH